MGHKVIKKLGRGRPRIRGNEMRFSVRFDEDMGRFVRILFGLDKKRYGRMSLNSWIVMIMAREIKRRRGEIDKVLEAIYVIRGDEVDCEESLGDGSRVQ